MNAKLFTLALVIVGLSLTMGCEGPSNDRPAGPFRPAAKAATDDDPIPDGKPITDDAQIEKPVREEKRRRASKPIIDREPAEKPKHGQGPTERRRTKPTTDGVEYPGLPVKQPHHKSTFPDCPDCNCYPECRCPPGTCKN